MKRKKMDERTRMAIETIKHGDYVRFYSDTLEGHMNRDETFAVQSETYRESKNDVEVKLHGYGWVSIGKLYKVGSVYDNQDEKMKKALKCCADKKGCQCDSCPLDPMGPDCERAMLAWMQEYIQALELYCIGYRGKRRCR